MSASFTVRIQSAQLTAAVALKRFFRHIRDADISVEELNQTYSPPLVDISTLVTEVRSAFPDLQKTAVRYRYNEHTDEVSPAYFFYTVEGRSADMIGVWSFIFPWLCDQPSVTQVSGVWDYMEETGDMVFEGYDGKTDFNYSSLDTPVLGDMVEQYLDGSLERVDIYDIPWLYKGEIPTGGS